MTYMIFLLPGFLFLFWACMCVHDGVFDDCFYRFDLLEVEILIIPDFL